MNYVNLGQIINVRGLKGELKIASFSDFSTLRYQAGQILYFYDENNDVRLEFKVSKYSKVANFIYLKVEGIDDIDTANKYRNYYVQYAISDLPKLDDDNYYYYELLDCVVNIEGVGEVGKVIAIEDNAAHPLLRVKGEKEILIPFVKYFLLDVDVKNKHILIRNVEGLL